MNLNLDEVFKYKIGQHLGMKRAPGDTEKHIGYVIVAGRILENCPGGVQLHYVCYAENAMTDKKWFLEEVLEPYDRRLTKSEQEEEDNRRWEEKRAARKAAEAKP